VVLLDVVIGHGAHEDPAGAVARAVKRTPTPAAIVASVTGTEADPQGYTRQVHVLQDAGVIVAPSNAHAAELAARLVSP